MTERPGHLIPPVFTTGLNHNLMISLNYFLIGLRVIRHGDEGCQIRQESGVALLNSPQYEVQQI